jgi:magnesium chelatase subunit I
MELKKRSFLFSAIVGQEKLKTAYLANIVNPNIGGLLVTGPKGTGKSTIVHSIAGILPEYDAVEGCVFNCDPAHPEMFCTLCRERDVIKSVRREMRIVTLPLSCTEDRLMGSIDVEHLLKSGEKKVQTGLLGEANRNILYVDEVNLLPDHLVDDILDAAASPWNTIEREGVSITHPDTFILVGSMNPEEGELRPQILDRFPLCVWAASITDPIQRVEIVKRNLLYESNPERFVRLFQEDERALCDVILSAKALLPQVTMDEAHLYVIAESCAELKVDGQRPDIVIVKTSQTIAALAQRQKVQEEVDEIQSMFSRNLQKAGSARSGPGIGETYASADAEISRDDRFLDRGQSDAGDRTPSSPPKKKARTHPTR